MKTTPHVAATTSYEQARLVALGLRNQFKIYNDFPHDCLIDA